MNSKYEKEMEELRAIMHQRIESNCPWEEILESSQQLDAAIDKYYKEMRKKFRSMT